MGAVPGVSVVQIAPGGSVGNGADAPCGPGIGELLGMQHAACGGHLQGARAAGTIVSIRIGHRLRQQFRGSSLEASVYSQ